MKEGGKLSRGIRVRVRSERGATSEKSVRSVDDALFVCLAHVAADAAWSKLEGGDTTRERERENKVRWRKRKTFARPRYKSSRGEGIPMHRSALFPPLALPHSCPALPLLPEPLDVSHRHRHSEATSSLGVSGVYQREQVKRVRERARKILWGAAEKERKRASEKTQQRVEEEREGQEKSKGVVVNLRIVGATGAAGVGGGMRAPEIR